MPTLPAMFSRAFTRRDLLQGVAAVAASSLLSGCGVALVRPDGSGPGALPGQSPLAPQPLPVGALTAASLTVGSTAGGSIDAGFLGLAYEKQALATPLFTAGNSDLVGLFLRLGPGVLRVGGSSVDQSVWSADGRGQTVGEVAPTDVDALAGFLRATGWGCMYGINLGGSATGATTQALAAAEVAYVAAQLGSGLMGIELGNACEAYGNSFYAGNWSVEIFEALWQQFRSAIAAVTPCAPICGAAAASNLDNWTLPFGEYVTASQINRLTQQYTRGLAPGATAADLLSPDAALADELLTLHEGAQSIGVPFHLESVRSSANGGAPGVSNAYAASLWAIDLYFQAALGGASGLNFVSGGHQADAVLADSDGKSLGPQAMFYGLLLASMAGRGTLLDTRLTAGALNVTAYAVQLANGGMSLVLVNKDAAQSLDVRITLPQAMSVATLQQMAQLSEGARAPSLAALSGITLQGAQVATDGGFQPHAAYTVTLNGANLSCYVPALSAVLIRLS